MEYRVRVGPRAVRDLEAIYEFIGAESVDVAFEWFNALVEATYSLERFPERGATTSENRKVRHLLFGRKPNIYRIIYAVDKKRSVVNVLHIRHGARARRETE
jgi:plasmid stabilization system protein ParE